MNPNMTGIIDIGPWQLALALVFVLLAGVVSLVRGLGLERDLAVGTVRAFVQLTLMGYALKVIFALDVGWLVLTVFCAMIAMAVHTIRGRVKERRVAYAWPLFATMLATYLAVTAVVTGVVIQARPWWTPQYFIPIGGMVVGNSMTAIAISLERLFSSLRQRRDEVEMRLCLGADVAEATADITRDAVKAGMIPSINSLMAVGLVFLPGMMTGQILSGTDPLIAIRYQLVVMCMLAASTALGSMAVVRLVRSRCFGPGMRPVLRK